MLRRVSLPLHNLPPLLGRQTPRALPRAIGRRQKSRFSSLIVAVAGISEVPKPELTSTTSSPPSTSSTLTMVYSTATPLIELGRRLRVRPTPQLGLLSLFFVLSTAVGAIFCLAILSIPTMTALARLSASMNKLSNVVSKEVPGTLSSLKLSGLEINELTEQLTNIRQKISGGSSYGKKDKKQ
ncbi:hypothetical protein LguiA_031345 [Lonicera macranthoides]